MACGAPGGSSMARAAGGGGRRPRAVKAAGQGEELEGVDPALVPGEREKRGERAGRGKVGREWDCSLLPRTVDGGRGDAGHGVAVEGGGHGGRRREREGSVGRGGGGLALPHPSSTDPPQTKMSPAAARPLVTVQGLDGAPAEQTALPAVFLAPIRPDVVGLVSFDGGGGAERRERGRGSRRGPGPDSLARRRRRRPASTPVERPAHCHQAILRVPGQPLRALSGALYALIPPPARRKLGSGPRAPARSARPPAAAATLLRAGAPHRLLASLPTRPPKGRSGYSAVRSGAFGHRSSAGACPCGAPGRANAIRETIGVSSLFSPARRPSLASHSSQPTSQALLGPCGVLTRGPGALERFLAGGRMPRHVKRRLECSSLSTRSPLLSTSSPFSFSLSPLSFSRSTPA